MQCYWEDSFFIEQFYMKVQVYIESSNFIQQTEYTFGGLPRGINLLLPKQIFCTGCYTQVYENGTTSIGASIVKTTYVLHKVPPLQIMPLFFSELTFNPHVCQQ